MFERFQTIPDAPMRDYTTLRLGGPADWLITPGNEEELILIMREAEENKIPVTVIGRGSNLLVLDGGIRGAVIRIAQGMRGCSVRGNRLLAEGGTPMSAAAAAAAEAGLTGLEFASGIPGTVGGGVIMNAGAYGGEMSQVVAEIRLVSRRGERSTLRGDELGFSYRHSKLQEEDLIVTGVTFCLQNENPDLIRERMAELKRKRAEKQPLDLPSAGSTFKRPEGAFAAALIDQCGLKGLRVGGAMVSPKHAGFLVNTGNSARDFLKLVRTVQEIVRERTGILLETEIRILGQE